MQEKYGFVYIWYDRKRKMYYIGSHWGTETDGYICSSNRMRNVYKRRPEDFKRRILSRIYSDRKLLLFNEQQWLEKVKIKDRYYNIRFDTMKAPWWTDEYQKLTVGQKISKTKTGMKATAEARANMSAAKIGKHSYTPSEETKQKISTAQIGKPKNLTPEGREIQRQTHIGNKYRLGKSHSHTEEAKSKISIANKGKIFTEEHRTKISNARKGMKFSEEHKYNIGSVTRGITFTDEEKNMKYGSRRKTYRFMFDDTLYTINSLKQFCKDNDLDYNIMVKLNNDKYCQSTYRGWSKA